MRNGINFLYTFPCNNCRALVGAIIRTEACQPDEIVSAPDSLAYTQRNIFDKFYQYYSLCSGLGQVNRTCIVADTSAWYGVFRRIAKPSLCLVCISLWKERWTDHPSSCYCLKARRIGIFHFHFNIFLGLKLKHLKLSVWFADMSIYFNQYWYI